MALIKTRNLILAVLWLLVTGVGVGYFVDLGARPGVLAKAPAGNDSLVPNSSLPRLLILIHPKCPCSRATLSGIERLMARNPDAMTVRALFYKPDGEPDEWAVTDTWRQASSIPGVSVSTISDAELPRFGSVTSGQVFLYDTANNLVFSGGVNVGRGMEGDNTGLSSIETYLRTGTAPASTAPVFGCILYAPSDVLEAGL